MNRKVLLGVTGSISAYKACELVRLFVKNGDDVTVVMTQNACEFVTPLTFKTLSRNQVYVDAFAPSSSWKPSHIALAEEADIVVIAPASANTIAKIANGIADNLLTDIVVATKAPILVAPAMNSKMWENSVTQENVARMQKNGVLLIDTKDGELACGVSGNGCLADPLTIYEAAQITLSEEED
ncbi:MAG: hypothetical protein J6V88_00390 [Kiritimatiellae bacterium]|nr:hypothetical protein [Kiritimatiellia bacterium]